MAEIYLAISLLHDLHVATCFPTQQHWVSDLCHATIDFVIYGSECVYVKYKLPVKGAEVLFDNELASTNSEAETQCPGSQLP